MPTSQNFSSRQLCPPIAHDRTSGGVLQSMFAPVLSTQSEIFRICEVEMQLTELEDFLEDHGMNRVTGQSSSTAVRRQSTTQVETSNRNGATCKSPPCVLPSMESYPTGGFGVSINFFNVESLKFHLRIWPTQGQCAMCDEPNPI